VKTAGYIGYGREALLEQARNSTPAARTATHGACMRRAEVFDHLVPWPALADSWRETAERVEEMGIVE
jgi:hypothetical protein